MTVRDDAAGHGNGFRIQLAEYDGGTAMQIRRYAFLLLLIVGIAPPASAQCLQGAFSGGAVFATTGNAALDAKFVAERNLIGSQLGLMPAMYVFDDGASPNAFAVPAQGAVYFGRTLLTTELWNLAKGEVAVAGIMAHEFTHLYEAKRGTALTGTQRELLADFMAGWYLGRKSYLMPVNVAAFARSLYEKGDYAFWSAQHHGTPAERVNAMVRGFHDAVRSLPQAYSDGVSLVRGSAGHGTPDPTPGEPSCHVNMVPCAHTVHHADVTPCSHPLHPMGDVLPCAHVCYGPFGPTRCHPMGDVIPCTHRAHPNGDLSPCVHRLHPQGDAIRVCN